MAKRKPRFADEAVETFDAPEITDAESVTGDRFADDPTATYHAIYHPLWHSLLDCGKHGSLDEAKESVHAMIREFVGIVFFNGDFDSAQISLDWSQGEDGAFYAYGHDGSPTVTTLPLAKIAKVSA